MNDLSLKMKIFRSGMGATACGAHVGLNLYLFITALLCCHFTWRSDFRETNKWQYFCCGEIGRSVNSHLNLVKVSLYFKKQSASNTLITYFILTISITTRCIPICFPTTSRNVGIVFQNTITRNNHWRVDSLYCSTQ